jgi:hypothetical protein
MSIITMWKQRPLLLQLAAAAAAATLMITHGCYFSRDANPTLRVRLGADHDACTTHQMQALHRLHLSSACQQKNSRHWQTSTLAHCSSTATKLHPTEMSLRCGTRLLGHLSRGRASRLLVSAPGATPPSSARPVMSSMPIATSPCFMPIRNFAIKTHMSEPAFHSIADRTIQRFIDVFDW